MGDGRGCAAAGRGGAGAGDGGGYTPRESWRAAAAGRVRGAGRQLRRRSPCGSGTRAGCGCWSTSGERAEGEEEFPEDEAYPVHQFPEITEFLHERWAGGGEPDAWVETADGPGAPRPRRPPLLPPAGRRAAPARPGLLRGRADRAARAGLGRAVRGARRRGRRSSTGTTRTSRPCWPPSWRPGIAQTERLEEVRRLAFTDPLTGLANRRAVDVRLDEAVERHRADGRRGQPGRLRPQRPQAGQRHARATRSATGCWNVSARCSRSAARCCPGRWPRAWAGTSSAC